MKKIVSSIILMMTSLICLMSNPVHSQNATWETLWIKSAWPDAAYSWMIYLFSGIAYDKFRDKLYVVSIKSTGGVPNPEIWILNPATGDTLGKMKLDKSIMNSGFSNGIFCVFKIQVAEDGCIYACNVVAPSSGNLPGAQGPFKVFKWTSPDAMPILVYPKTPTTADSLHKYRWGDAFAVIGTKDSTQIFISGGYFTSFNSEFAVLQATDTTANKFYIKRRMSSSLTGVASHGLAPTGTKKIKPVWVNSILRVSSLQSQDSIPVSIYEVPDNIDRLTSGSIRYFEMLDLDRHFIITCDGDNADGGDSTRARLIDVTTANAFFKFGEDTPAINNQELVNTGGTSDNAQDVDYKLDGHRLTVYVLMSGNGIGAFKMKYDITPVELMSFSAVSANDHVELRWLIAQETNNSGFEIQRSFNGGKDFERIGFVKGRGTTNEAKEYFFSDPLKNINTGISEMHYRLKQIDTDGKFEYSPVAKVLWSTTPDDVILSQNYPNPIIAKSGRSTMISYSIKEKSHVSIKLYNILGNEIATLLDEEKDSGTHSVNISSQILKNLNVGMYFYKMNAGKYSSVKKMTVMK